MILRLAASRKFGILCISVFATLLACTDAAAQNKDAISKPKYGVNKPLGDAYASVKSVVDEQTRLVMYRSAQDSDKPATKAGVISVYLNERYHTSLQKEAFSVICLSGNSADLRTRYLPTHNAEIDPERDTRQPLTLKGGQSIFLRVSSLPDEKSRIDIVTPQTALNDLNGAKQQMHTLSRVPGAQPCREANDTRIAFDPNVITFGSDAIFDAHQTDISNINKQGRQELKQIVQKINIKYKTFKDVKVHVVGFANDGSDESLNQRLSTERAQSIRTYLKKQGLRSTALTYEGRGSQEREKAELLGLSPRRVEIEVEVEIR